MANSVVKREDFDKIKSVDVKLGILFETNMQTLRLLKGKRLDAKAVTSGFLGGFAAVLTKMLVWR